MATIVLIHGYSAESDNTDAASIESIYGTLPRQLRERFGQANVVTLDLSRYISLDDGVTLDDIAAAMDACIRFEHPELLAGGAFDVIIHSTGALVIRNWLRLFGKPNQVNRIVYLAGANFGSGWAHIGKGQLAKWGRLVFDHGSERGIDVLNALELGSTDTLDLHLFFLREGRRMYADYHVRERVIIGSEANVKWFELPIRYAKEDGSDGVVRVSGGNLNFNYLRYGPKEELLIRNWRPDFSELLASSRTHASPDGCYELKEASTPGDRTGRPILPLAIPYACAHSGETTGIVVGAGPRQQVLDLITTALSDELTEDQILAAFDQATAQTYDRVRVEQKPSFIMKWIEEPRAQYDRHAQIIFRIVDQNGRPVTHFDVYFSSVHDINDESLPIQKLFEDNHINSCNANIITFYVRLDAFDARKNDWVPRLPELDGCHLEVTAIEPGTDNIAYVPMRLDFPNDELLQWIKPHVTTVIDITLLRVQSPDVFRISPLRDIV